MTESGTILVTGATGYVGARLVTRLLAKGHRVRATGRSLARLRKRPWANHPEVELLPADVIDHASIAKACAGCQVAYYLVHSMMPGEGEFEETDREAARTMARTAEEAGLSRLIYLGGLGEENPSMSRHLRSRAEVAEILAAGTTPTTILRAAMILGAGSASRNRKFLCPSAAWIASRHVESSTGIRSRIRVSRQTTRLESPSASGRATSACTGVTRWIQYELKRGVRTGTGITSRGESPASRA